MKTYLHKKFDWNNQNLVSQYDELPLWSAPFGLLLLDNIPLKKYDTYLDIGSGTGFPLIDISQRLGSECKAFGIDPWEAAAKRANFKIETLNITNVKLINKTADKIPFPDDYFDLITSNLGINNFEKPSIVLAECYRVIKPDAPFCLTTNLVGHFNEFYEIFFQTLNELDMYSECKEKLNIHINHRGTVRTHEAIFKSSGFKIKKIIESTYNMRFFNGTSFLNHSVIMSGFLPSWLDIIKDDSKELFFEKLEKNLNNYSEMKSELKLTVPIAYIECVKK